jgi:S1-C subfamily serine protease
MKVLISAVLVSAMIHVTAQADDINLTATPSFDKAAIASVEFDTTAGKSRIGSGSFVRIKETGHCYFLTVRHLLGPNADFKVATQPRDVPSFVKGIHVYTLAGTDHYYSVTGLVIKPTETASDPILDLAAFPISDPPDDVLTMAENSPGNGEPLFTIAKVRGGVPEGEIVHGETVVKTTNVWLNAYFDEAKIDLYGASGAPVLNLGGQVVGIHSGHGNSNGKVVAFIIPAPMILAAIKAAETP